MRASFSSLSDHSYIAITTFARNGQPVTTPPFWFAQDGDKLYVMSSSAAEVRQIHENAQVEVAPCTQNGQTLAPSVEAMALALSGSKAAAARHALNAKYGLQIRLHELAFTVRLTHPVYLEITPM
jgi:PPOX class probable F420-dependent enzyme